MQTDDWFHDFPETLWLKPYSTGEDDASFLMKALRLRKGSNVLDVPCGTGRISLAFARRGIEVTGIDINHDFLSQARRCFRAAKLRGHFQEADMRQLALQCKFDAALVWGGCFGYFSDFENLETIRMLAAGLKRGGRLLIDQPSREHLLRHFKVEVRHSGLVITNVWQRRAHRIQAKWTIQGPHRLLTAKSSIRLYSPSEMIALYTKCGLRVLRIYGSKSGESYGRSSKRMIIVGSKK